MRLDARNGLTKYLGAVEPEDYKDGWAVRLGWLDEDGLFEHPLSGYSLLVDTYEEAERLFVYGIGSREFAHYYGRRIVKVRRQFNKKWNPFVEGKGNLFSYTEYPEDWSGHEVKESTGWARFPLKGTCNIGEKELMKEMPTLLYSSRSDAEAAFQRLLKGYEADYVVKEARRLVRGGRVCIVPEASINDGSLSEYFKTHLIG